MNIVNECRVTEEAVACADSGLKMSYFSVHVLSDAVEVCLEVLAHWLINLLIAYADNVSFDIFFLEFAVLVCQTYLCVGYVDGKA